MFQKDGLLSDIYYLFWEKDSNIELSQQQFRIEIPDTVLLKNKFPFAWYFTAKDGKVMRKNRQNASLKNIYDVFSQGNEKSGVAAQLVYEQTVFDADKEKNEFFERFKNKCNQNFEQTNQIQSQKVIIEYFTKQDLYNFLFVDKRQIQQAILQKFVEPVQESNYLIQCIWSPQMTLFSRSFNNKSLADKKFSIYERLPTFDGPPFLSTTRPIKTPSQLQNISQVMDNIAKHIASVSFNRYNISRMVAYFKKDKNGKYIFHYCTSLRQKGIKEESNNKPLQLENQFIIPNFIKRDFSTNSNHPKEIVCFSQCVGCNTNVVKKEMVEIQYYAIIKDFQMKLNWIYHESDNSQQDSNFENFEYEKRIQLMLDQQQQKKIIPPILRKFHPNMTVEQYQELKVIDTFQQKKGIVCLNCYMDFSKYLIQNGDTIFTEKKHNHHEVDKIIKKQPSLKIIQKSFLEKKQQSLANIHDTSTLKNKNNSISQFSKNAKSTKASTRPQSSTTMINSIINSKISKLSQLVDMKNQFIKEKKDPVTIPKAKSQRLFSAKLEQQPSDVHLQKNYMLRNVTSAKNIKQTVKSITYSNFLLNSGDIQNDFSEILEL